VRLTDKWLGNAITEVKTIDTIDELITMVLLTWCVDRERPVVVIPPLIPPPPHEISPLSEDEIVEQLKIDAITTILTTFPTLGPISQYLVLATMSEDPSVEAVEGMLKEPNTQTAIIIKLLRLVNTESGVESLESPWFKDAKESDNKSINTIAAWVYSRIESATKTRSP
jgi:hypothetical protein